MATVRVAIARAMRDLRAIAPGDDPTTDELIAGLEAAQTLILELHEARGPLWQVDAASDYVAGQNQRVRVEAGDTISVTLPNAVAMWGQYEPYDYGFTPLINGQPYTPAGSTGPADYVEWKAPDDGARIEIVGATQALYFYRADLNQWMPALGLTVDAELPLNERLTAHFEALLAEALADTHSTAAAPPLVLQKRIARARAAMFLQSGRHRSHHAGEYF